MSVLFLTLSAMSAAWLILEREVRGGREGGESTEGEGEGREGEGGGGEEKEEEEEGEEERREEGEGGERDFSI